MKKLIIGLSVLLAFGLILAGCSGDTGLSVARAAAPLNTLTWNDSDANVAVPILPTESARTNASGPKIPSNAHSADFPGIYFRWDKKQKDSGYLKVQASVFDDYKGFVLTKKVSNTYWDYPIGLTAAQKEDPAAYITSDNCYVFAVPDGKGYYDLVPNADGSGTTKVLKDSQLKNNGGTFNINMVFIPEFELLNAPPSLIIDDPTIANSYVITFKKVVYDAKGNVVPFGSWANADKFMFDLKDASGTIVASQGLDANSDTVTFVRPNDGNYTVVERPVDGYVTPQAVAVAPSVQKASVFLVSKDNSKTKTTNVSYMVDTAGTWKMPGSSVDIKTQWNQGISGNQAVFNDMMQYNPTWIWDRQDSWAWGTSGSDIIHYTTTFHIDNLADIVPRDDLSSNPNGYAVPIYFACDNAAVLFVNGQFVACTANAFAGRDIPTYESGFTDLSNNGFDGNAWQTIYYADIFPFLNAGIGEAGDNQVVFYAANSEHVAGDTANSSYDTTNNPCGLIFAGVINMAKSIGGGDDYQFVNTVKPELGVAQGSITGVNAGVNGATQVASPSNSWFTYVDLQGKDLVTGIDIDMVSGNQGNKIYSVVGKAFVQLIGSNLQLTVKGEASTQNDSGIAALVTNQFPDKNPNSWVGGHTAENPRLIPYNGEKFLYIHTNGFRFLPIN